MSPTADEPSEALRNRLADHETLQWHGKPHRLRTLLRGARFVVPALGVLWMVGVFVLFMVGLAVEASGGDPTAVVTPAAVVAAIAVVGVVGIATWVGLRRYDYAEYAATEARLVAFGGVFGRDYSAVDWSNVRDLEVTVNAFDRLFDTGRIEAVTEGSGGVTLRHVSHPYEQVETFEAIRKGERTDATAQPATPSTSESPSRSRSHTDAEATTRTKTGTGTRTGDARHDVSQPLRRLLRDGEELRWHYRPPVRTYLLQYVFGIALAALVLWSIVYGLFVGIPVLAEFGPVVEELLGVSALVAVAGGWVVGVVFWCLVGWLAVYNGRNRVEFAATDQRAVKLGGMVGLDTSTVEWANVQDIEGERHLLTRVLGTGNVVIRTAGGGKTYKGGGVRFGPLAAPMEQARRIEAVYRGEDAGEPILRGDEEGSPATTTPTPVALGDLSGEARRLLADDESLVWRGTPALLPFVAPSLGNSVVAAVIGIAVLTLFQDTFFAVAALLAAASIVGRRLLRYHNAEYVATDQRVLQFDGAVGRNSSSVEWDDVQDVEVRVGLFDGYAGTGTLRFSRAGGPTRQERQQSSSDDSRDVFTGVQFRSVKHPWVVQEVLENR